VHQRALILGERTFGKGSVQQVLRLNHNDLAFLKLTTALYYLPDGRCLHRDEDATVWGVDPDVMLELAPKEVAKVSELRLKRDILKGMNQDNLTEEQIEELLTRAATSRPAGTETETGLEGADDEDALTDADPSEDEEVIKREDPNNWPAIDPQFDAALLLMRVRLESQQPWPMQAGLAEVAARGKATAGG
jgi:carboxyl-terminal processing protease